MDQLHYDQSAVEYLMAKFGSVDPDLKETEVRKHLGRFGLTGVTHLQKINTISGGQKSRVVFAEICLKHPHLLFLDGNLMQTLFSNPTHFF